MTLLGGAKATITIGNRLMEFDDVVKFVEAFGVENILDSALINDLNLCLDEVLNNIVSYAYENDEPREIQITLSIGGQELRADVRDDGKPFDPTSVEPKINNSDLKSRHAGGIGLVFVRALMDTVDYVRTGKYNCLTLVKKILL